MTNPSDGDRNLNEPAMVEVARWKSGGDEATNIGPSDTETDREGSDR